MNDSLFETIIGAVVAVVAVAFAIFALSADDSSGAAGGYELVAHFNTVNGVARGSDVRMSGVKIGSISSVELDTSDFTAKVVMRISDDIRLPVDSVAKISSDSLLGGSFLSLDPGVEDDTIPGGGRIAYTRSSVDFLTLLAQFVSGSGK